MKKDASILATLTLVGVTLLSGLILASSKASAEDSATTTASVTVPVACSMAGHTDTAHNASLIPGTYSGASGSEYEQGIGKTTLTTFCNDNNGFSIYAIGFTGDSYDGENHTKLVGTSASGNAAIATKVYESTDIASNWSMKVTKADNSTQSYNPANMSITNSFNNWHIVPDTYTKVAEYHATTGSSTTDTTLGAKVETTYATYISTTQPAGTYTGKVKYTMVHPYNEEPLQSQPSTARCINYFANASDAVGTMGCQYATDGASVTLLASNFSRTGYGFAGWSDSFDYATNSNAKFYGPNETITVPAGTTANGLSLYAVWVKSQGSLQDSNEVASVCSGLDVAPTDGTANFSSVSALTDQRDNNTYAIAKLADGKCWMIENLRLEAEDTRTEEKQALAQGYGTSATYGNFGGLAGAESANFENSTTVNSLYYSGTQEGTASIDIGTTNYPGYRMPRYNNWNNQATSANRPQNPTTNSATNSTTNAGMYSYGNYYTWHAAIANTTNYNSPTATDADGETSETVNTSLCPTGWRLPYGRSTGNGATVGGFYNLNYKINNDSNVTDSTASLKLRSFPNNFLYSGYFGSSSASSRGSLGYYWSSTACTNVISYNLYLSSSYVLPGSNNFDKYYGYSIRCVSGS